MSVNSLANFGVPGLNGDRSAALQPIFSNRFRVLVYNFGQSGEPAPYDITRQIRRVGRPNVQFETTTMYSYVSTVYVASRGEWQEITFTLFDDITNSAMRRVENQVSKQQNFFDQTMSRAGENYKFEMDLDVLAGGQSAGGSAADPNIIQKYCFAGCFLSQVDKGEMSYDDVNAMEITCTVRYDNVISFDQNGNRMGTFNQNAEIQSQSGVGSTGSGTNGGFGISIAGASVNVGFSGLELGGATVSGNIGSGGSNFGISF